MAVNINFEDIKGREHSFSEREILREVETETEDGVPAVAIDTTQGFYMVEAKMWHEAKARVEKSLYEVLHSLRNEHNERLCDMAKKIGIKTGDLYRIENGLEKNCIKSKEVLAKIEKVYNLGGIEIAALHFGYVTTYGESKGAS